MANEDDKTEEKEETPPQRYLDPVRIVLVEPIYGGNIGSVCRAMANMGLADLAIVNPPPFDEEEARAMACHAGEILRRRSIHASLAEAIADCAMIVGTSARDGLYRRHSRTPRAWAPKILDVIAGGSKAALVFGREDSGLTNEELALCTHVARIPTTESYRSVNIAQAVLLCCYELFVASGQYEEPEEKSPAAPSDLRERMFAMWRETMLTIGFMDEQKADHMMQGLRRVLSRGAVTVDDVHIVMGIARQSRWAAFQSPERFSGSLKDESSE